MRWLVPRAFRTARPACRARPGSRWSAPTAPSRVSARPWSDRGWGCRGLLTLQAIECRPPRALTYLAGRVLRDQTIPTKRRGLTLLAALHPILSGLDA